MLFYLPGCWKLKFYGPWYRHKGMALLNDMLHVTIALNPPKTIQPVPVTRVRGIMRKKFANYAQQF